MNLSEVSFRNLVNFFEPELRAIHSGEKSSEVLTYKDRRQLLMWGALRRRDYPQRNELTDEAKKILRIRE